MADRRQFDSFVLQFAPYAARTDHVSIGVVLVERSDAPEFAEARFVKDWRTVQCMRPDVDLDYLDSVKREIVAALGSGKSARVVKVLQDSSSNGVRLSAGMPMMTDDPAAELRFMEEQYLRAARPRVPAESSRRMRILGKMQEAFEQAGVWEFMRKQIAAELYTYRGDPLKIDCGYENGKVKMFQAVSLASGVDSAKVLAYSWPQMAEGVRRDRERKREERKDIVLTAIVEDKLERQEESVEFAFATLESGGIEIAVESELGLIAERARQELGA